MHLYFQIKLDFIQGYNAAHAYFLEKNEEVFSKLKEILRDTKLKNPESCALALSLNNLCKGIPIYFLSNAHKERILAEPNN